LHLSTLTFSLCLCCKQFYRGTLWQMIIFGTLSFCGVSSIGSCFVGPHPDLGFSARAQPSMSDAISGLGGGGLSTPYLANAATAAGYATSAAVAFFGGPLINQIGIKNACILAALCFPLVRLRPLRVGS
jgi:hypothetical protein